MKVTLEDVAKQAGVSRATVDRVLNERGNVSQNTIDRVHRALYSTNYLVEPLNGMPTNSEQYSFDFIFPALQTGYFEYFNKEIVALNDVFSSSNAHVRVHMVDAFNAQSLSEKLLEIGKDSDGIAFVGLDHPIIKQAVHTLSEIDVGTLTLVSDITGSKCLGYVGIDNRAAGRTAGLIMGRFLNANTSGKVAILIGSHSFRAHEEREAGFKSMLREQFKQFQLVELPETLDNDDNSYQFTQKVIQEIPDLVGIYNIAGGTQGVARAIKENQKSHELVFIAHELNDITRQYLVDGTVDAIINQDIKHEVYNAVEMLLNHKHKHDIYRGTLQPKVEIYLAENFY